MGAELVWGEVGLGLRGYLNALDCVGEVGIPLRGGREERLC